MITSWTNNRGGGNGGFLKKIYFEINSLCKKYYLKIQNYGSESHRKNIL